jgi:hypothetical protein
MDDNVVVFATTMKVFSTAIIYFIGHVQINIGHIWQTLLFQLGKNTIKGAMVTKVGVLTMDYILHVFYMYWFIKYQNYILNVIFGTGY